MGHGRFSKEAYERLKVSKSYANKTREQIFQSRRLDPEMDPRSVHLRESRDSEEHPESLSIIVGLDVTGSMGFVPVELVKNTFPHLMDNVMQAGIEHPQVLFLGLGDHECDQAPLQIGQFESSTELLDKWLTKVYLEGGGGGNAGESYHLAYLAAARHTAIDCWDKRKQKGFLFTIGDEPCLRILPGYTINALTPDTQGQTIGIEKLLQEAQERYHVFHLHVAHNAMAKMSGRYAGWKELLGDNFIMIEDYTQVASKIASLVVSTHTRLNPKSTGLAFDGSADTKRASDPSGTSGELTNLDDIEIL